MKPNTPDLAVVEEEEMIGPQRIAEMRREALLIEDQREVRNPSLVLVIHWSRLCQGRERGIGGVAGPCFLGYETR